MSGAKGKGGTGRGTDKKGWNRWQASAKKKSAAKVFGKKPGDKGAEDTKKVSVRNGKNAIEVNKKD